MRQLHGYYLRCFTLQVSPIFKFLFVVHTFLEISPFSVHLSAFSSGTIPTPCLHLHSPYSSFSSPPLPPFPSIPLHKPVSISASLSSHPSPFFLRPNSFYPSFCDQIPSTLLPPFAPSIPTNSISTAATLSIPPSPQPQTPLLQTLPQTHTHKHRGETRGPQYPSGQLHSPCTTDHQNLQLRTEEARTRAPAAGLLTTAAGLCFCCRTNARRCFHGLRVGGQH